MIGKVSYRELNTAHTRERATQTGVEVHCLSFAGWGLTFYRDFIVSDDGNCPNSKRRSTPNEGSEIRALLCVFHQQKDLRDPTRRLFDHYDYRYLWKDFISTSPRTRPHHRLQRISWSRIVSSSTVAIWVTLRLRPKKIVTGPSVQALCMASSPHSLLSLAQCKANRVYHASQLSK